jgi:hypothetical protein
MKEHEKSFCRAKNSVDISKDDIKNGSHTSDSDEKESRVRGTSATDL